MQTPSDVEKIAALEKMLVDQQFPLQRFGKVLRLGTNDFYGAALKDDVDPVTAIHQAREILSSTGWSCVYVAYARFEETDKDSRDGTEHSFDEVLELARKETLEGFFKSVDEWLDFREKRLELDGWGSREIIVPEAPRDLRRFETGILTFFPVPHTWQIPAYWDWGNVNSVPAHGEVLRILEYFENTYAAEIISFVPMLIELQVGLPPKVIPAAQRLAAEQTAFCPDIYQSHFYNPEDAAENLLNNPWWYFWWD